MCAQTSSTKGPDRSSDPRRGAWRATAAWGLAGLLGFSAVVLLAPGALAAATPQITVSPGIGYVGTNVTLQGSGFLNGSTVQITFNDSSGHSVQLCAACVVNLSGGFTENFTIPQATNGSALLTATGFAQSASTTFEVASHQVLARTSGPPLASVSDTGTGFDSAALTTFSFGTQVPAGTCNHRHTSTTGRFLCGFVVPQVPFGPYPVTTSDAGLNNATNTVPFFVEPGGAAYPDTGAVGSNFLVGVDGFPAYAPLSVLWDAGGNATSVLATVLTSAAGVATTTVVVPPAVYGNHTVDVVYSSSVSANFTFLVLGNLSVTPASGYDGETGVLASAQGLPANVTVNLTWDPSGPGRAALGSSTSSSLGSVDFDFTVPYASRGSHALVASVAGAPMANASFAVDLSNVTLGAQTAPPGGSVSASLRGFAANRSANLLWDPGLLTQALLGNGTTNATGALELTGLVLPADASPGVHAVAAYDAVGDRGNSSLIIGPWLSAVPASGPVGGSLQLVGSTFGSGSAISLYWNSTSGPLLATVPALAGSVGYRYGNFSVSATVPDAPYGPAPIVAVVGGNVLASTTFEVGASLALSSTRGPVGTSETATATGLAAGALCVLWVDGSPTGLGAVSNASGDVRFSFTLPPSTSGPHAYELKDAEGDASNVIDVTVTPSLTVTEASAYPGAALAVTLEGFSGLSIVTVAWDGNGTATRIASDPSGSAQASFTVPGNATTGPHELGAWDLANESAPALTVTVLELNAPQLSGPDPGAWVNRSSVTFAWQPAPSGAVSYVLVLSTSSDLSSGLLVDRTLSNTSWTVPALTDGSYFWSVEAVAPGGSTTAASAISSFEVDTQAPSSAVEALPATVSGLSVAVPFAAEDPAPGSGVVGVELLYSSDGGRDWVPFDGGALFASSPIDFRAASAGSYEFQTVALDLAGNQQRASSAGQATVVFDPTAASPNYAPLAFGIGVALCAAVAAAVWGHRAPRRPSRIASADRPKAPVEAPKPWQETEEPAGPGQSSTESKGGRSP